MARQEISLYEKLMLMHSRIQERNINDINDPIPRSDTMLKHMFSDLCDSYDQMISYLQILCDSHYLFSIRYVEPEPGLGIPATDGYVSTDYSVINKIFEYSQRHLERIYEGQFYKTKGATAILQELFPKIHTFKNTPLGEALNEMVMIQQHQQIMKENPSAYVSEWKKEKLKSIINEYEKQSGSIYEETADEFSKAEETDFDFTLETDSPGVSSAGSAPVAKQEAPEMPPPPASAAATAETASRGQRATDTAQYLEIEQMNTKGAWGQAYEKYGAEFLIRIHFRKHEFSLVRSLIKTRRIAREKDLRFIRDTLREMEKRIPTSPDLQPWKNEITELRRLAQFKLNQILIAKKGGSS